MTEFSLIDHPHRRFNPLTGEWVLNSPHRNKRPWQGKQEEKGVLKLSRYDSGCYLCPGNERANGERNPDYGDTFVFKNDFSALLNETYDNVPSNHPLLKIAVPRGICRVVCFSPRHDLTLPQLPVSQIKKVIDVWADQVSELGEQYRWVQIFENKGDLMGCSNPHPHCQIWASDMIPNEPSKEDRSQREYFRKNEKNLLLEYQQLESIDGSRTVIENSHWLVVTPFWAIWPFETLILPKRHVLRVPDLEPVERELLADILKRLLTRYDNLFQVSFPYSMGWHGAPNGVTDCDHWQLHAHIYPPLLRSAAVRKFMVGYETLAEPQRDLTPEQAADRLRSLSEADFRLAGGG